LLDRNNPKGKCYWGNEEVMKWAPIGHKSLLKQCDPYETSCNIFGHVCPVFVMAEPVTETQQERYSGRLIPRDIMLKVVRRDNYICQMCGVHVPDDQIELDHIIPYSKGGPTTVDNLRLLCRPCNRKKASSLAELLNEFAAVKHMPSKKSEKPS
jgi:hypothetical protein